MDKTIVYDIETLKLADEVEGGWENPAGMGFGSAVAYHYGHDRYNFFMSHQREQFEEYLSYADSVVTYNGIRFDNCIVQNTNEPETPWQDIDLLDILIRYKFHTETVEQAFEKYGKFGEGSVLDGSMGLDAVSRATLHIGKSAKLGAKAPAMIAAGRWDQVFAYNLQDVRCTKRLFEFIVDNKYAIDGKGNEIAIDFGVEGLK